MRRRNRALHNDQRLIKHHMSSVRTWNTCGRGNRGASNIPYSHIIIIINNNPNHNWAPNAKWPHDSPCSQHIKWITNDFVYTTSGVESCSNYLFWLKREGGGGGIHALSLTTNGDIGWWTTTQRSTHGYSTAANQWLEICGSKQEEEEEEE